MVKFATNVSGAILLPSSIQVTESISGSVVPLAMFFELVAQVALRRLDDAHSLKGSAAASGVGGGGGEISNNERLSNALFSS